MRGNGKINSYAKKQDKWNVNIADNAILKNGKEKESRK